MQTFHVAIDDVVELVALPAANAEWSPGRRWGDASVLLTPAWIAKHAHMRWRQGTYAGVFGNANTTLAEEVTFCLLSGFGIKAETARAAYHRLRDGGVIERKESASTVRAILEQPLSVNGRQVRYRFPHVRANYIAGALQSLSKLEPADDGPALRSQLLSIKGIGLKTASFIARNHLLSNDVAILDIHLIRAGQIARIFPRHLKLPRDYRELEVRFLQFAFATGVPASILDMTVWEIARAVAPTRLDRAYFDNATLSPDDETAHYDQDRIGADSQTRAPMKKRGKHGREQQHSV